MAKIRTEIEFPKEILLSLKEDKEEFTKNLKLFGAIELYRRKKLSLGKAAQLAETPRLKFLEIRAESGISIYDYPEEELDKEIANIHACYKGDIYGW